MKTNSPADADTAKTADSDPVAIATDTDPAMTAPALSSAATAHMETIRDQWLLPLVDRIEELSRETGRLAAERDQAARERDALRVERDAAKARLDAIRNRLVTRLDAPQDAHAAPLRDGAAARADPYKPSADTLALHWRRWWRRMTGG